MHSKLIDFDQSRRVPAKELLSGLLEQSRPHAEALDCVAELEGVRALAIETGADRQTARAQSLGSLPPLVEALAGDFLSGIQT